jgi:hypothetical protein
MSKSIKVQGNIYEKIYELLVNIEGSGLIIAETMSPDGVNTSNRVFYKDETGAILDRECQVYQFTMIAGIGGTTDIPPGVYKYPDNWRIDFKATPEPTYIFSRWLLNGANASTDNPSFITTTANKTIQPVFAKVA